MKRYVYLFVFLFLMSACSTYTTQYVGFRPASDYPNSHTVAGATIGAEAFADNKEAKQAFGFDIKKAGLLPVQVVMDNKSGESMEVVSGQTFLVDNNNRYWTLIPNQAAVERVSEATEMGAFASGATKGATLGAAGGAILGAAFGILSGDNVLESAGKGAAVGGAGGAVIGGTKKGTDPKQRRTIADDIRDKGLEGKSFPNDSLANGFLFFPAEAETAKELKVQIKEKTSGKIHSLTLVF
nr:glycine zipper family protein [Desulfobulbaceae bacterium]